MAVLIDFRFPYLEARFNTPCVERSVLRAQANGVAGFWKLLPRIVRRSPLLSNNPHTVVHHGVCSEVKQLTYAGGRKADI